MGLSAFNRQRELAAKAKLSAESAKVLEEEMKSDVIETKREVVQEEVEPEVEAEKVEEAVPEVKEVKDEVKEEVKAAGRHGRKKKAVGADSNIFFGPDAE